VRPRHLAFCRLVAAGADPIEAVVTAGYKGTPRRVAARLMLAGSTVAYLDAATSGKREALALLAEAREIAVRTGDAGALVESIALRCRIEGLL
jgi:hypothetical protein